MFNLPASVLYISEITVYILLQCLFCLTFYVLDLSMLHVAMGTFIVHSRMLLQCVNTPQYTLHILKMDTQIVSCCYLELLLDGLWLAPTLILSHFFQCTCTRFSLWDW